MAETTASIDVHAQGPHEEHQASFFAPDVSMMILTWVTFFLLLAVLYKSAWKPILAALDEREQTLKKSLEEADRLSAEMERLEQTRQEELKKAREEAKAILDESRRAANEASKHIQQKAKDESQILIENAKREIKEETERAQAKLREESINVAVELAGKIIEEKLDKKKNRHLIDEFIKEN